MGNFTDRLQHAWNVFFNRAPTYDGYNGGYGVRPDRSSITRRSDQSIVKVICNRIAMDAAAINIKHVYLDDKDRYIKDKENSSLNYCLNTEANIDQSGRAFIQDVVMSMLDEGCVAMVPIETDVTPGPNGAFDVCTMRVGKIVNWYPEHVRIRVYNERTGLQEEIVMPKKLVGIVENPLYSVMNEPNSTVQRLIRKLNLMDIVDEQSSSGKLDLIIQLPYVIKTEARKQQAEERRKSIEDQLAGSKYGIAYTDGTEHITQLNRSLENNLMKQVEYLTDQVYDQLGITREILNGTADEKVMLNYTTRIVEPILSAIIDEMKRKFLSKTARSQRQSIMMFYNPFKLVPANDLAEISDKMTRNEILTSNEVRQIIGIKPSDDPGADQLRNKNLNADKNDPALLEQKSKGSEDNKKEESQNE